MMSAINIFGLEAEWQDASNGFSDGADFKTWLAGEVISLRATVETLIAQNDDRYCPLCTWRGLVELDNGICPQCGVDWPKSYREYRDALTVARERIAAQARQLSEARSLIDQSCSDAVAIVNMSDDYVHEMAEHLANQLGAWLAANPAPQAEQTA